MVDHIDQKPHQMLGGQPIPHVWSQQEAPFTTTGDEPQPQYMILLHLIATPSPTSLCATGSRGNNAARSYDKLDPSMAMRSSG
ncbi:hypothetical protein [Pseudonocardia adelaidensis]|uniref:Uncharacterized protein n=1 Tax=Pseudonocardia adelaidensis TaxID=648754 RepID=A0ABP9NS90_9PSEU